MNDFIISEVAVEAGCFGADRLNDNDPELVFVKLRSSF